MDLCSTEDCDGVVRARGMCNSCYEYQRLHGTVIRLCGRRSAYHPGEPIEIRVWRYIDKNGPLPPRFPDLGPCWVWTGRCDPKGYGRFRVSTGWVSAHRTVWKIIIGPLDDLLQLDHLCLIKCCVRPDHLEPVTNAENMRRAVTNRDRCRNGHDLAIEPMTLVGGKRLCPRCVRERFERFYARHPGYREMHR